ncbi:MAG: site-specific integrase [Bacteroidia bacterium]|nr:site-specific integrase [Bacteroidia bacterium]
MSHSIKIVRERPNKSGFCPLYLRITINRRKKDIKCNIQIKPEWWDETKGTIKDLPRVTEAVIAKRRADNLLTEYKQAVYKVELAGQAMNFDTLLAKIGGGDCNTTLVTYFKMTIDRMLQDREINEKTHKNYLMAIQNAEKFDSRTKLREFSTEWLIKFQRYLLNTPFDAKGRMRAKSTVHVYMTYVLGWLNKAFEQELIPKDPRRGFKKTENEFIREIQYLTIEEVNKLQDIFNQGLILKSPQFKGIRRGDVANSLQRTLGRFLFSCYTGLRYSDNSKITWDHFEGDYIKMKTQKTGSVVRIPISSPLKELMQHMKLQPEEGMPLFPNSGRASSVDGHLIRIMEFAQIPKHISFHCSRHTFATMALTMGLQLNVVSKLIGHASIIMTQRYAKIVDRKIDEEMELFDPRKKGNPGPKPFRGGRLEKVS